MFALYVADNYQGTLEKKKIISAFFVRENRESFSLYENSKSHAVAWEKKEKANSQQCGSKGVNKFYFRAICLAGVHRCFRSCLGTPCSTHKTSKSN